MGLQLLAIHFVFINSFYNWLIACDKNWFIIINNKLTNPFLDALFPIWREAQTWYPLYLFLLVFTVVNFGRRSLWWLLFFGLTIGLCDQISSGIIKDFVNRPRPCTDPELSQYVRLLLNRCPGSGSFTSSHATNHFGMAVFVNFTFNKFINKGKYLLFVWAVSICYAQVYIGVHYPIDVFGGALLGSIIGYFTALFYNYKFGNIFIQNDRSLIV